MTSSFKQKGPKLIANFYGDDDGYWMMTDQFLFGADRREWDWAALSGMYSRNEWRVLSVEGATPHHTEFRKALKEMVRKYPELVDWQIEFDGEWAQVSELVGARTEPAMNWSRIKFYHGTSSTILAKVLREGLRPRSDTNVEPAYGAHIDRAAPSRVDAVYLASLMSGPLFAFRDAVRKVGGRRIVFEIVGVDEDLVAADEDSRQADPRVSLEKLGSIAYLGTIHPRMIKGVLWLDEERWQRLGSARVASRWLAG